MKRFIYILVCLLICVGIGGGAYVLAKNADTDTKIEQPDNSPTDGNNSVNSGHTGSGNADFKDPNGGSSEEEEKPPVPLTSPTNESSLIADGLEMVVGAQLYVGDDAERPMLRFTCNVTPELKTAVEADGSKRLGMLVLPLRFLDRVNTQNYTYIDWINALEASGVDSYYLTTFDATGLGVNGNNYYMRFRLEEIPYGSVNTKFACIGVLITANGNGTKSYQYSAFPNGGTYRSNARSAAYVAGASLNAYTLGQVNFTESALSKIRSCVNEAVDEANGLAMPTDNGSTFVLNVSTAGPKTLAVGEAFKVSASYAPSRAEVPIWYRSTDESVVRVDADGNVTALKAGTAVVGVYVAGEAFGITVTVS